MEGLKNEANKLAQKYTRDELADLIVLLQHEMFAKKFGCKTSKDMVDDMYIPKIGYNELTTEQLKQIKEPGK